MKRAILILALLVLGGCGGEPCEDEWVVRADPDTRWGTRFTEKYRVCSLCDYNTVVAVVDTYDEARRICDELNASDSGRSEGGQP